MTVSISDELLAVLGHMVDYGNIELGTEQSAKLIDVSTRVAGIESAARTIAALCDENGVPPVARLADMDTEWGRSWRASFAILRDVFGAGTTTKGVLAERAQLLAALRELLKQVDIRCGGKTEGHSPLVAATDKARSLLADLGAR